MDKLKPYPHYKDSGVPWLGEIPVHWDNIPLFSAFKERQESNKGLRENQVLSLSYGRIIKKKEDALHGLVPASFETYQIVKPGNLILRLTDLQNDQRSLRVGLAQDRGIITSAYLCLEPSQKLLPAYAYYFLHSADVQKVFYAMGSGLRQSMGFTELRRLPVAIPSLAEQERIVRFLNFRSSEVDRFIRAKQQLIKLLNEQKQAIIHHAVTRGLEPDVPLKPSGIEWLGDVPEHWEVVPIKRAVTHLIDTEHKTAPAVEGGHYLVVRTSNIRHGKLILKNAYYTDESGFREWTRRGVPQPGDILFTREAPAGEACVVPQGLDLCMGQRVVLMRLDQRKVISEFAMLTLQYGVIKDYIRLNSHGSTVPHFNMSDIAAMPILLPTLDEQLGIVSMLSVEMAGIDTVLQQTVREIDLIREYRTRLIADVVTGKLDVRNVQLPALDDDVAVDMEDVEAEMDEVEDEPELVTE